jgi:hypothetical protein
MLPHSTITNLLFPKFSYNFLKTDCFVASHTAEPTIHYIFSNRITMNHRISTLTPSTTGCFLSQLLHDRLGPGACFNVKIIDDNARTIVTKKRHIIGEKRKLSRERQDKAQLHIASRWGEGLNYSFAAGVNDRWSTTTTTFESKTIRGQVMEDSNKDIHTSSSRRSSVLPISELQFSKIDFHTIPEKDEGCQYSRVLHHTVKAISSSPRLPRRRKSCTGTLSPVSVTAPIFIKQ